MRYCIILICFLVGCGGPIYRLERKTKTTSIVTKDGETSLDDEQYHLRFVGIPEGTGAFGVYVDKKTYDSIQLEESE